MSSTGVYVTGLNDRLNKSVSLKKAVKWASNVGGKNVNNFLIVGRSFTFSLVLATEHFNVELFTIHLNRN